MIIAEIKRIVFLARIYLLLISCAGFHTMVVLSITTYFIDIDYIILRLIGVTCFIGLSFYFLIAFPNKLQETLQGKIRTIKDSRHAVLYQRRKN